MGRSEVIQRRARWVLAAGLAGLCGLVIYFIWFHRREEPLPTTAEVMASNSSEPVSITVGPSVQVSLANAGIGHRECVIAADPTDARRLTAAAMFLPPGAHPGVVAYRSADGGSTWTACYRREHADEWQADPDLTFGRDGELHFVLMTYPPDNLQTGESTGPKRFRFLRSTDGGQTWREGAITTEPHLDRPFLAVDRTSGPYRGRVYCPSYQYLHTSSDGGLKLTGQHVPSPQGNVLLCPTAPVVLSDGTMLFAHLYWLDNRSEAYGLRVLASTDGGRTILERSMIQARWRLESRNTTTYAFCPQLVADANDRLFAVWEDGNGPNRARVLFSRSEDQGQTWARPVILSEQPAADSGGYGAHMACLAVNKEGVIALTWYDRRGLPDTEPLLASNNYGTGCNVRLRVSLDGGRNWASSVQVNDKPIRAKVYDLRDTAGLAADAAGAFHPAWIDDSTGTLQVWTASITVGKK
jgi:hypothetical protein